MAEHSRSGEKVLRGIPVSAGVRRGKILVFGKSHEPVPRRQITEAEVPEEIHRLEQALIQTRHQIQEVQRKVSQAMGAKDARIFDAHLLVLDDPTLIDEVARAIQEQKVNVELAFQQVAEKYAATLSAIDDEYLRAIRMQVMQDTLGPETESTRAKLAELERLLFPGDDPWSERAFRDELRAGHPYLAARDGELLVGYAGLGFVAGFLFVSWLAGRILDKRKDAQV